MSAEGQAHRCRYQAQLGGREADEHGGECASEHDQGGIGLKDSRKTSTFPEKAADHRSQSGQQTDY
ncbi:hypothetical protein D3C81_2026850 [compost metagenome]